MPFCTYMYGGLINSKGEVGLFRISQRGNFFHLLYQPIALGDNLTMQPPFLHSLKKVFLSPSVWPRRKYTWPLISKKSFLICFESCEGVPYSYRQSRKRMMNTFIMVSITHIRKGQFRG